MTAEKATFESQYFFSYLHIYKYMYQVNMYENIHIVDK